MVEIQEVATATDDSNVSQVITHSKDEVYTTYYRFQDVGYGVAESLRYNPRALISMQRLRQGWSSTLEANGGYTVVVVRNPQTGRYHIGVSRCSTTDRFQRKTGRAQALQYALQAQEQDVKLAYPLPHGKRERSCLYLVLQEIPLRFLVDDDTVRRIDPYSLP